MNEEQPEVEREPMNKTASGGSDITRTTERNFVGMIIGAAVVLIGLGLLGGLLELLPTGVFLPLPWVAVGLFLVGLFVIGQGGKSTALGLLLLLIGAVYLARYSGVFGDTGFHQIWLIAVILGGIVIFIGSRDK